jgi:hypothetical protein
MFAIPFFMSAVVLLPGLTLVEFRDMLLNPFGIERELIFANEDIESGD